MLMSQPLVEDRYRVLSYSPSEAGLLAGVDQFSGDPVLLHPVPPSETHPREGLHRAYQLLAPLEHPVLPPLLDATLLGGTAYLVFPASGGRVSTEQSASFPWSEMVAWTAAVAEGLDLLHRAGLRHGDIHPGTVLIDENGLARLAHLGLAVPLGAPGCGGQPETAAPEVLADGPVDERSDLFSLGATLFFWLFSRKPFQEGSAAENSFPSSSVVFPPNTLPGWLLGLLAALLDPDPNGRPSSAREVASRLADGLLGMPLAKLSEPRARARSVGFLGKPDQLETFASAWTWPSRKRYLAITAPPRSGVFELMTELERRARQAGRRVSFLCAHPIQQAQPVDPLAESMNIPPAEEDWFKTLLAAAHESTEEGPFTLLIGTEEGVPPPPLIAELPARFSGFPNLTIVAAMPAEFAGEGWQICPFEPLEPEAIGRLLNHIRPGIPIPLTTVTAWHRSTGGYPGRVIELALNFLEEGKLRPGAPWPAPAAPPERPSREASRPGAAGHPGPSTEGMALLTTMAASSIPTPLSCLARGAQLSEAAAAQAIRSLMALGCTRRLRDGTVCITPRGREWLAPGAPTRQEYERLLRVLAKEPLSRRSSSRAWRLLHLARLAFGAERFRLAARLTSRAAHLSLRAGRPETALAWMETVKTRETHPPDVEATMARIRGELWLACSLHEAALKELARAARLALEAGRTEEMAWALSCRARAFSLAGQDSAALDLLHQSRNFARSRRLRAMAAVEEGEFHLRCGNSVEALAAFDEAQKLAPIGESLALRAGAGMGQVLVALGRLDEALSVFAGVRRLLDPQLDPLLCLLVWHAEAEAALADRQPRRTLSLLPRSAAVAVSLGDPGALAHSSMLAARAHLLQQDLQPALRSATEAVQWAEVGGDQTLRGAALLLRGSIEFAQGEVDLSEESHKSALTIAETANDPVTAASSMAGLGRILSLKGERESAIRSVSGALSRAIETGQPLLEAGVLLQQAWIRLAEGNDERARSTASSALELLRREGGHPDSEAEGLALFALASADMDAKTALSSARRAFQEAEDWGNIDAMLGALAAEGKALWSMGDRTAAEQVAFRFRARIDELASRLQTPEKAARFRRRPDRLALSGQLSAPTVSPLRNGADPRGLAHLHNERHPEVLADLLIDQTLRLSGAERCAVLLSRADGRLDPIRARGFTDPETQQMLAVVGPFSASTTTLRTLPSLRGAGDGFLLPLAFEKVHKGFIYFESEKGQSLSQEDLLAALEPWVWHGALALSRLQEINRLSSELVLIKAEMPVRNQVEEIVGQSPAVRRLMESLEAMGPTGLPVLITGESGTGKELVARALHQLGPGAEGPFVALNCAALPESILEGLLFGHEKGAFTGADQARKGLIEQAHGGTLFLDEVGDLALSVQARLLRVLEEGEVRPLGAAHSRQVRVRIVAATHRDLAGEVRAGRFRHDLLFRLDVLRIRIPPLRERLEDLPLLVQHILERLTPTFGQLQVRPGLISRLSRWSWPGNVRELENTLTRLALHAEGGVIDEHSLAEEPELVERFGGHAVSVEPTSLERLQVDAIRRALEITHGNREQAAKLLGIGRATIFRKIRLYGLGATGRQETSEPPISQ